jgi:hypothetical protein
MQGILYEEPSAIAFIVLNVLIGGWASWQTGRAAAQTWRPMWLIVPYAIGLGLAVRFLHFAVFAGSLLSPWFLFVDALVAAGFMLAGYRWRRSEQMSTQYRWMFARRPPFGWVDRGAAEPK